MNTITYKLNGGPLPLTHITTSDIFINPCAVIAVAVPNAGQAHYKYNTETGEYDHYEPDATDFIAGRFARASPTPGKTVVGCPVDTGND